MSKDDRRETTEEKQQKDIYLMHLERDLIDLLVRTDDDACGQSQ
jgi:hypothetical protein